MDPFQPIFFGLTPLSLCYYLLLISSAIIAGNHRRESETMSGTCK